LPKANSDPPDSLVRLVLAVITGLLLALAAPGLARAHAELRGTDPAADSVLDRLPDAVALRFSEPVGVLTLSWLLPDGREFQAGAEAGANNLSIDPPPEAGRGTYVLRWRVASTDGHPVGGALVFSVGEVSGTAAEAPEAERTALAAVALRAAMVCALVLSVGAAVFHVLVAPLGRRPLRLAAGLSVLVLPLGLMWLGAEGLDRLGFQVSSALQPRVWAEALYAPALRTVILAAVASLGGLLAIVTGSRGAALSAWALASLSFTVSGHALSASTRLAVPLTFLHGAALIFWVGSLLPLGLALVPLNPAGRAALLRRFSWPALAAVILLIGSGAGLILIRSVGIETLTTPWGQLLGVKLTLVAAMLALALWHRAWAIPQLERGQGGAEAATVRAEWLIGLVVLCLAMGFRLAPPPVAPVPDPPRAHLHSPRAMADIELSAAPPGAVSVNLFLADARMDPLDPLEVRLVLTDPTAGIGPLTVQANRHGPGLWVSAPVTLPSPGPWEVRLLLLVSDFEQLTLTGELELQGNDRP
jgi:copper transport protein